LVNVTYSNAIVVKAAKSVQETQQWHEEEKIFSNKWVKNVLYREKITTEDKVVPTDEENKKNMKDWARHVHRRRTRTA
jgi:hypothetical protein